MRSCNWQKSRPRVRGPPEAREKCAVGRVPTSISFLASRFENQQLQSTKLCISIEKGNIKYYFIATRVIWVCSVCSCMYSGACTVCLVCIVLLMYLICKKIEAILNVYCNIKRSLSLIRLLCGQPRTGRSRCMCEIYINIVYTCYYVYTCQLFTEAKNSRKRQSFLLYAKFPICCQVYSRLSFYFSFKSHSLNFVTSAAEHPVYIHPMSQLDHFALSTFDHFCLSCSFVLKLRELLIPSTIINKMKNNTRIKFLHSKPPLHKSHITLNNKSSECKLLVHSQEFIIHRKEQMNFHKILFPFQSHTLLRLLPPSF